MEVTRIFDILDKYANEFPPKEVAIAGKDPGGYFKYSTAEYIQNSNYISYGLLNLGVTKGDKIASITFNRPEWNFLDMGILQIGAIHVSIYPTISDADYEYILKHAEVKYIFVAGIEMYNRIKDIIPNIPTIKTVYTFRDLLGFHHLSEVIELGAKNQNVNELKKIKESISEHDIATIIYTSGTIGTPKGVILSHRNIISNFINASKIPPYDIRHIALSFLPICHIYERMLNYMYQYMGLTIYYSGSLANLTDNFKEFNPHIFSTVPRLLEKIYDKIIVKGNSLKGLQKKIFNWSLDIALKYDIGKEKELIYGAKLYLARKLVLNKIKETFGKNIHIVVSGGAAIQLRLCRFFWATGVYVLEGYGLTETSPVITVNSLQPYGAKFGTVGLPYDDVELRIAEDGEILCKTPGLMLGYYKDEVMTNEVIDNDGWFHTGDIGIIENSGHLRITDRKKLIFKTSFGKYIAPQLIENKFKESIYIDQIMVFGENQKFAAALIVPEFANLNIWCLKEGLKFENKTEMINHPEIKKLFRNEINHLNSFLGDSERVMQFELLDKEWGIESGELSATLKIRRSYINVRYKEQMRKIFPDI